MSLRVLLAAAVAAFALSTGTAFAAGDPVMPLSDVQPGMDCTAYTVVQGTTITSFDAQVVDVVQDPQFGPRILVNVSGPAVDSTGIAEGMSGSPVYCPMPDGSTAVAGALSAGIPFTEQGEVTPIQQMLGEPVLPPPAAARDTTRQRTTLARMRPLAGPISIGGLSPAFLHLVQHAAASAGRVVVAEPRGASDLNFPIQPLVPGAAVAVSYSTGAIPIGAVGTVTYNNGSDIYAFGHELDGAGRRSLILQDAFVDGVSFSPFAGAFKLAVPGHTLGILTADTPNAVVGILGGGPTLVPVDVSAHDLNTGQTINLSSQVADETNVGLPLGASIVDLVAPLEAGEAATEIFNGPPALESGHMCAQIWLRESPSPLRFCNRYLGVGSPGDVGQVPPPLALSAFTDLSTAFSLIEQEDFARLHVTRVSAQIKAERGLAEARLVSASAPARVRPGQLVTVRLRVHLFRGTTRTITFRMRIPRHVRGMYLAVLHGPQAVLPSGGGPQGNGITGGLGFFFGGPGGPPGAAPTPPTSMAQLRSQISEVSSFDGLSLPSYPGLTLSSPGRRGRHVYLDPSLIITGSAPLAFLVK